MVNRMQDKFVLLFFISATGKSLEVRRYFQMEDDFITRLSLLVLALRSEFWKLDESFKHKCNFTQRLLK